MMEVWRVGRKVPINVYEGDRPVCQCHTVEDAQRIVSAMMTGQANDSTIARTPAAGCPACESRKYHTAEEWKAFHPDAGSRKVEVSPAK